MWTLKVQEWKKTVRDIVYPKIKINKSIHIMFYLLNNLKGIHPICIGDKKTKIIPITKSHKDKTIKLLKTIQYK